MFLQYFLHVNGQVLRMLSSFEILKQRKQFAVFGQRHRTYVRPRFYT